MTKRDFFRLIIKIFGLYFLVQSMFVLIPTLFSNISIYKENYWVIVLILGSSILTLILLLILLNKTDFIIDKMNLTKGFDDEKIILGDFKNEQIFKLAIILIGGFLVVDYVPNVLFELINVFKKQSSSYSIPGQEVDYYRLIISFSNIFIGLILINNYKNIATFLDKK